MNIGIDARSLKKQRGIGNVVYNLLKHFKNNNNIKFIIYIDNDDLRTLIPNNKSFVIKKLPFGIYPLWEQIILPIFATFDQLDVLHCPANSAPIFLSRKIKLLITVHDIIYCFPDTVIPRSPILYQNIGRRYLSFIVPKCIKRADKVVTVSYTTKKDIQKFLKLKNIDYSTIYSSFSPEFQKKITNYDMSDFKKRYNINNDFIFALGSADPRKNTRLIIDSFTKIKKDFVLYKNLKLILVGLEPRYKKKIKFLVKKYALENEIVLLDFVSELDLILFYKLAKIFLYPSLYEGFGLPILEAMISKTPIITMDSGSIKEIAEDAAFYLKENTTQEMTKSIKYILENKNHYSNLVLRGSKRSNFFSWDTAAKSYILTYKSMIKSKNY
jgi:glycosyltransferase involved in cell wall biosynthesis